MNKIMKYVSEPRTVTGWHYETKCLNCDVDYHAKRSTSKFCSDTCRIFYHIKKKNGLLVDKKPIEKKQPKQTTPTPPAPVHFNKRYLLTEYLLKEHKFHLGETPIKRNPPKVINIRGQKWEIKRTSHMEYTLNKI